MTERALDVFFYGLFMDRVALIAEGYHPGEARIVSLDDYELQVGERATLVPSQGQTVWGVVMALPAHEIKRLYSGNSVSTYCPEAVLVSTAEGEASPALCYNQMVAEPDELIEPDEDYVRKLAALAERLDLPQGYVSEIEFCA